MGLSLNELNALNGGNVLGVMTVPTLSRYDSMKLRTFRDYQNEVLHPNILMQCGHFNTLYDNVAEFQRDLSTWSRMRYPVWEELAETTLQEYNLLNNYDRTEEWTESRTVSENISDDRKDHYAGENATGGTANSKIISTGENSTDVQRNRKTLTETESTNANSVEDSVEKLVSAHNSETYSPREKETRKTDGETSSTSKENFEDLTNTESVRVGSSGTEVADSESEYASSFSNTNTLSGNSEKHVTDKYSKSIRAFGNIGVTTSQQMLEEQRKLVMLNMVQFITNEFKEQFCILVY